MNTLLMITYVSILPFLACLVSIYSVRKDRYELIGNIKGTIIFMILHIILSWLGIYFFLLVPTAPIITMMSFTGCLCVAIVNVINSWRDKRYHLTAFTSSVLSIILFVTLVVMALVTSTNPMTSFNSLNAKDVKSEEVPTLKKNETPIAVSVDTAKSEVKKSMSDIENSQYYDLNDNLQAQYYKGKPVYVATVDYHNYWASRSAKHIAGYFIISATDPDAEPQFIQKDIKYSPSAYFGKNSDRQIALQSHGYLSASNNAQLEIDDDGTPYFVETMYKPSAINQNINYKHVKIAVLNAETGDMKLYGKNNLPKFIDEAYTSDVVAEMNDDYASYNHGFWNTTFIGSKTGVSKPTENGSEEGGVTTMFNKDGSISYIEDYTSPSSKSHSAIGYSSTNARTGEITYYHLKSVMDSNAAIDTANENFHSQKWQAKMPVLYNIYGHPTWVMSILDNTHTLRGYYYLDGTNQNIYANASTSNATLEQFRQALVSKQGRASNKAKTTEKGYKGIVDRNVVLNHNGKSIVEFTIKGEKTIFTVDPSQYEKAALIKPNDKISFKASVEDNEANGNINDFKNE